MRSNHVTMVLSLAIAASVAAVAPVRADDKPPVREAEQTLAAFEHTDPALRALLQRSAGYAVFPTIGKGAVGVGGAHGTGVLFDANGTPLGKTSLTQVTVGVQLGGQSYSELVVFENHQAMSSFQSGNFALSANASAVAVKNGAAASAPYKNGVAVFTATKGGLMFEASVGGQKFSYEPMKK